jgi:ATP phosphoribosyltransferase
MVLLLEGAIRAEGKVGLKMNVSEKNLKDIIRKLPALKGATISTLSEPGWFALEVIVDEEYVRHIVPELKRAGAAGSGLPLLSFDFRVLTEVSWRRN